MLPVTFGLDDDDVVFRTGVGSVLDTALADAPVGSEVDGVDAPTRTRWSVLLRGRARHVRIAPVTTTCRDGERAHGHAMGVASLRVSAFTSAQGACR